MENKIKRVQNFLDQLEKFKPQHKLYTIIKFLLKKHNHIVHFLTWFCCYFIIIIIGNNEPVLWCE